MSVYWEDLTVDDEIPLLEADISSKQLFQMSAVTQNPHRIHYDKEWALHEGYPERVIHGPLQGEMLSQLIQGWLGTTGWLKRLEYSNRAYAVLGEHLVCREKLLRYRRKIGITTLNWIAGSRKKMAQLPHRDQLQSYCPAVKKRSLSARSSVAVR